MKNTLTYILLGALLLLSLFTFKQCSHNDTMKHDAIIMQQNLTVKKDSLKTVKLKNDTYMYEKGVLVLKNKDLKKENSELYKSNKTYLKSIKKKDQHIIALNQIIGSISGDGGEGEIEEPITNNDSSFTFKYSYDKTPLSLNGHFNIESRNDSIFAKKFYLDKWSASFELTTSIIETNDNLLKFNVVPKDTNMHITNVDAIFFDPAESEFIKSLMRKKRWSFGPTLGVGIGVNPFNGDAGLMIFGGVAITYSTRKGDLKRFFSK